MSKGTLIDVFLIGGTDNYDAESLPFIGIDIGELRYQRYIYGRSALRLSLAGKIFATATANIVRGKSYNQAFLASASDSVWETKFGMGLSLGVETLVGPVVIDAGTADGFKNLSVNVGVGYRFIRAD